MGLGRLVNRGILAPLGLRMSRLPRPAPTRATSKPHDPDADDIRLCAPYTLVDSLRQLNFIRSVRFVNRNAISGAIVECGVFKGGSMMLAKLTHQKDPNAVKREFHLFDTFAGMANPVSADVYLVDGSSGVETHAEKDRDTHTDWFYASLAEVQGNFRSHGLLDDSVFWHRGLVEDTLRDPANVPPEISILRLDTDFYESTKIELEVLYPRLVAGGVLIVDDYDAWAGSRAAVDEYFEGRLCFATIGGGGIMAQKAPA